MLAVTRFNENTFNEYYKWKQSRNYNGCIYNCPVKISSNILPNQLMYVIEMNNSINKIEGIGIILNHTHMNKKYKIYNDDNYNRYTYKSKYRIDKKDICRDKIKYIEILEILIFTGSKHIKRGHGIQKIPNWISKNKSFNFSKFIAEIFLDKYN